jgi:SAM-dependent methyltransferase
MNSVLNELRDFARLSGGFRASRVILTANNFGIFEYLNHPLPSAALAKKIKTDGRATEILLDALTALGLLRKTGGKYRNAAQASKFLVKSSPWYQGDMLRHSNELWKSWSGLDEVVKTGRPNRAGGRDYEVFIRAMHNNAAPRVAGVIDAVGIKGVETALDLGGGPGTYSRELAKRGIHTTLFDLPDAIKVARRLGPQPKKGSLRFLGGDFHSDDIGNGYDLVLVSQILHSLSPAESVTLLKKAGKALNRNGRVAIHEFLLEKDRARPVPGALFSVNMLVNTPSGRSYTPQEMKSWLIKAGFNNIKTTVLGETVVLKGKK